MRPITRQAADEFAEEADARNDEMLGNYPLLFSQVEYIRAVLTLSRAKSGHHPLGGTPGRGRRHSAPRQAASDHPPARHTGSHAHTTS